MNKLKKEHKKFLIIILILILVDQILKFIVVKNNNFTLIDGILKFCVYENTNGTYGVGNNSTIMYILTNLVVIIIAFQFLTSENQFVDKKTRIFLALIIAGGASNCIDRAFRGYVVEFIDFTDLFSFPIFNFADICILVGWISMVAMFTAFTAKEIKSRKDNT